MKSPRWQTGRSLWEMAFLVVVLAFVGLLGLRLVPVYLDYRTIVAIAEGIQEDPALRDASDSEVRSAIRTRMSLNNLRGYNEEDIYEIAHSGGMRIIRIEYEKREPFVGNIDVIASFEQEIEP